MKNKLNGAIGLLLALLGNWAITMSAYCLVQFVSTLSGIIIMIIQFVGIFTTLVLYYKFLFGGKK